MEPDPKKTVKVWGQGKWKQTIEIGKSTWNPKTTSIRNRYDKNGKFSRSGSSEMNPEDLEPLICHAAKHGLLTLSECKSIIKAVRASITRQRKI